MLARLSKRFHRTEKLTARRGNPKLIFGGAVWFGIILTCILGIYHASELTVKRYDAEVAKDGGGRESLRVVLIADLHLGYSVGAKRIEDMVEKVNAQNADIVLIAGDIFDNTVDGIDDPESVKASLRSMKSRLGVYACWGNHDVAERLFSGFSTKKLENTQRSGQMERFVRDSGIIMLEDEARLIDDSFYVIAGLMADIDTDKLVISLEHEPRFLKQNADAGVDVMLCGHTHDGQFFPLNIAIRTAWENPAGLKKVGGMTSVVTSGVGVYGPDMRIGTDADISVVDIRFTR